MNALSLFTISEKWPKISSSFQKLFFTFNLEQLIQSLYRELHRLATRQMVRERDDHTLSATGLVHEAYIKLSHSNMTWESDAHFLNIAARTMRQVLVDHALAHKAEKRSGDWVRLTLTGALSEIEQQPSLSENQVDVVALDDLLNKLAAVDERQAKLVELRFFGGLSIEETACAMNLSPATIKREWKSARLFLKRALSP